MLPQRSTRWRDRRVFSAIIARNLTSSGDLARVMWRQLIFLHIPKTAGWALHASLLPIFGEAQSLRVNDGNDLARLRALSPREFSRYRYVSGHFTYNDVEQKCRDDALFVSILREPVRRLISEFNYIASWTGHPHHDQFKDLRFSNHVTANAAFI